MCPSELTISFGFLYSGVLYRDIGVCRTGALLGPPERVDVALLLDVSVSSAKKTRNILDKSSRRPHRERKSGPTSKGSG